MHRPLQKYASDLENQQRYQTVQLTRQLTPRSATRTGGMDSGGSGPALRVGSYVLKTDTIHLASNVNESGLNDSTEVLKPAVNNVWTNQRGREHAAPDAGLPSRRMVHPTTTTFDQYFNKGPAASNFGLTDPASASQVPSSVESLVSLHDTHQRNRMVRSPDKRGNFKAGRPSVFTDWARQQDSKIDLGPRQQGGRQRNINEGLPRKSNFVLPQRDPTELTGTHIPSSSLWKAEHIKPESDGEDHDDHSDDDFGGNFLFNFLIHPIERRLLNLITAKTVPPAESPAVQLTNNNNADASTENVDMHEAFDERYWADALTANLRNGAVGVGTLRGETASTVELSSESPSLKEAALGSLFDSIVDYFARRRFGPDDKIRRTKRYRKVGKRRPKSVRGPPANQLRSELMEVLVDGSTEATNIVASLLKLGASLVVIYLLTASALLWLAAL